jgi:4-hydroxybutyryl-CoA dehydratase/vinylacetyl-CoA-Delta-isomerase
MNRMKILRLIENITMGTAAVGYSYRVYAWCRFTTGQRIMIARQANMAEKIKTAKKLCGIEE